MNEVKIEGLEFLTYDAVRLGPFKWRAEFHDTDGNVLWVGKTYLSKKKAMRDVIDVLLLAVADINEENQ